MISEDYTGKCILCNKDFKDDIIHWATECENTLSIRNEWLAEITEWLKVMHKEEWKTPFINYLLKGANASGLEKRVIQNYANKATNFMRILYDERNRVISKLIAAKKKPPDETNLVLDINESGPSLDRENEIEIQGLMK